jgi:hypothetical protein
VKAGTENRKKVIVAAVLGVLAVVLMLRFVSSLAGDSSTPAQAAQPAVTPRPSQAAPARVRSSRKIVAPAHSLDPTLRFDWLKASEDTQYSGAGRNIFRAQAEPMPRPIRKAVYVPPPPPVPQGPPPPPPINLKFFGFASKPGEPKRIFLSEGDDVFVASEGDIVGRRYKILRISPTSVEVEDVLHNNRQVIPLTQG